MVGDGWKWQINKNTFRPRGGKIKLRRGKNFEWPECTGKDTSAPRSTIFLSEMNWKLTIILAVHFFFFFFPKSSWRSFSFLGFFFWVCDETENNTEWTAKSATPTGFVVDEVNASGTETCRQFPPAGRRRSTENIHTAVKHIVFHPVYMRTDKHGERGCLQRRERRR